MKLPSILPIDLPDEARSLGFGDVPDPDPSQAAPLASRDLSRRTVLVALAGAAGTALGCGDDSEASSSSEAGSGGASGPGSGGGPPGPGSGGQGEGGAVSTGGNGSGGAGGAGSCPSLDPACEPTEDNIEGPYYRPGAPFTKVLDNPSGEGDRLVVSGVVYASDCTTPLGGAVVEIWQANASGHYDNEIGDPGPEIWVLRASIEADECGRYDFESIVPGRYLNGPTYRPAHVHYRVTHPDVPGAFITQHNIVGDPFNDDDAFFKPSLAIELEDEEGPNGPQKRGIFDVVLVS